MNLAELQPSEEIFKNCIIYERKLFIDARGSFTKLFARDFSKINDVLGQIQEVNLSVTSDVGTIRGMHFQMHPLEETKLVTCLGGIIDDVVIDLRPDSSTFLQYKIVQLTSTNQKSILIPKGVAHGFQALSKHTAVLYCVDSKFSPLHQRGVSPLDSFFDIPWKKKPKNISNQDLNWPKWEEVMKSE